MPKHDVPQGTLELMILTIVNRGPIHGYGIAQRLAAMSKGVFLVNAGSLFPMLYKLEQDGLLKATWDSTENNRQAKYYRLTRAGKRKLEKEERWWSQVVQAISGVLEGA